MTALPLLPIERPAEDRYSAATTELNAWRGRCLASFARVERIVTETLVGLAQTDDRVPLPHLAGQRMAALEAALTNRSETVDAIHAITQFREHDSLRAYIAHGDAKITIDRANRWHVIFTLIALKAQRVERSFLVVDADEAMTIGRILRRDGQRLESAIRHLGPPGGSSLPKRPALRIGAFGVHATG